MVRVARAYRLDPALVAAVVWVESRFDPRARSPAGAVGLMQLMPGTARAVARRTGRRVVRTDPRSNLAAGCFYLRRQLDRFGSERLALAAYHAGPANARRYARTGRMPPGVAAYVERVLRERSAIARTLGRRGLAHAP